MKKYKRRICLSLVFLIGLGLSIKLVKRNDSIHKIPEGEYLNESTSSDGKYTVKTYLVNGGATVDWAVRGELIENSKFFNKEKNIYWEYHINESNITWKNNETVVINDIEIKLPDEKYDWRLDGE